MPEIKQPNAGTPQFPDNVFSKDFIERAKIFPVENKIYHIIKNHTSPYKVIEHLCELLNDAQDNYTKLAINGPQPQIIVTTQENIDRFKNKG